MNDFLMDIMGMTAVLKSRNFYKKPSTDKQRTVIVTGGPGCSPDPAYGRKIQAKYGTHTETISSYDLEYVIVNGKKFYQTVGTVKMSDIADVCPRSNPFK